MQYHSSSPPSTVKIGRTIASGLKKGDTVLLFGELGSGKTTLAKGILNYFGVPVNEVTSPSFVFVREYEQNGLLLYHADFYRTTNFAHIFDLDYADIMASKDAVAIIEWSERIQKDYLPDRYFEVRLERTGVRSRLIQVRRVSV